MLPLLSVGNVAFYLVIFKELAHYIKMDYVPKLSNQVQQYRPILINWYS